MKVVVLGCGPAGLVAAYAAERLGAEVIVFSRKHFSQLYGCQYLHSPIPGIDVSGTTVGYQLRGTAADYAAKVYGSEQAARMAAQVSPATLSGRHRAYDLRETYRQLYDRYERHIVDVGQLTGWRDFDDLRRSSESDLIVSSIPAMVLCREVGHFFHSEEVWAMGDAPDRDQFVPLPCPPDTVICDGTDEVGYYRVSNVFGHKTVEYPGHRPRPPYRGMARVLKPIKTDCDCYPKVLRIGRFGRWDKTQLVHHVYGAVVARVISVV